MKDIIPAKKQSPILGLSGMGGGVGSNIVAGLAEDPTYVDDLFSTYLYKGTGSDQTINNGIKLGNGGAGNGVDFDRSGDYLSIGSSSDFTMGTGDFTVECWVYMRDVSIINGFWQISSTSGGLDTNYGNTLAVAWDNNEGWMIYGAGSYTVSASPAASNNTWYHVAYVRSSGTSKLYINGTSVISQADTTNYNGTYIGIGGYYSTGYLMGGIISNLRVVKGSAVYTGNFTTPTKALTSVTNTKLLCCQSSTVTTATVIPGTIWVNRNATGGNPLPSVGPFTADDGEGGMVWFKDRDSGMNYVLMDTARGIDKLLFPDGTWSQEAAAANDKANTFRSFNNNGFTIGNTGYVNTSGNDYTTWTFRKQKGFIDIVTYTGTGSATTVAHNLGSIPGMIIIKRLDGADNWRVYHRGASATPAATSLRLDLPDTLQSSNAYFNSTLPTSSVFSVGTDDTTNGNGFTYVAYVFAGGASDAPGSARSVDFDGNDSLEMTDNADFDLGNGNFTAEMWVKSNQNVTSGNRALLGQWSSGNKSWAVSWSRANQGMDGWAFKYSPDGSNETGIFGARLDDNQWHHIAVVRDNTNIKLYTDGKLSATHAHSGATFYNSNQPCYIAREGWANSEYTGKISNIRLVKGTAVYTSSFRPPTEGLKAITNTKLLCCNKNTATGSTVTPVTITAGGDPQSSTFTPFDDPAGFKFGEEKDQNIIKCGNYEGNGDATNGTRVYLGFEPQWLLIKPTGFSEHWHQFDAMRGMVNNKRGQTGIDRRLEINNPGSETNTVDFIDIHPDGFTVFFNPNVNKDNENFVYTAIRRPDGLVGKPKEAGSDVFGISRGSGTTYAQYSGFPVDFGIYRAYTTSQSWWNAARLTQGWERSFHNTNEDSSWSGAMFDSNYGWVDTTSPPSTQSWMWKRHAGFDVVADTGDGQTIQQIPHGLGVVPQMIWRKNRNGGSDNWQAYHYMLNGGTTPHLWRLRINTNNAQANDPYTWVNAPTDSHFTVGSNGSINRNTDKFFTMLFASVEGVSKVGSYSGTGNAISVTTGFAPRFLIIKNITESSSWYVLDTTRGWGAGNDQFLVLDTDAGQSAYDFGSPTSTGFDLSAVTNSAHNKAGCEFIYYAHA